MVKDGSVRISLRISCLFFIYKNEKISLVGEVISRWEAEDFEKREGGVRESGTGT